MTEKMASYWVDNVAHTRFPKAGLQSGADPLAPVYGVDTPQRWAIPKRFGQRWPRLPIRRQAEREALSAEIKARVERTITAREAARQAERPWVCSVEGALPTRDIDQLN